MIGQYLPDRRAGLVLTAKVPEGHHKCRLRSQPAWLFYQTASRDVACCNEIAEVKPRPCLVDSRFIAAERAEPLRLLFMLGVLPEIAGIAVKHACHVVGARTAGTDSDRLLACNDGIVVATL